MGEHAGSSSIYRHSSNHIGRALQPQSRIRTSHKKASELIFKKLYGNFRVHLRVIAIET
jgi:hypothetical protein